MLDQQAVDSLEFEVYRVREVIFFSNELCIERKVTCTRCFVTVDNSFKAPTEIEHFFFIRTRLVANLSVIKLAVEQVSSSSRPRISSFRLL